MAQAPAAHLPTVAVSCDDAAFTDRRGQAAAQHRLDVCYTAALLAAGAVPLVVPHPLPAPHAPAREAELAPAPQHTRQLAPAAEAPHAPARPQFCAATRLHADSVLAGRCGLVLTGGDFDVPPAYYGEPAHPTLGRLNPARTLFEWALLQRAESLGMPILAICGGMQLVNVHRGGSLHQDVTRRPNTHVHVQAHDRAMPQHGLRVAPHSRLAAALGPAGPHDPDGHAVNSTHHQLIARVGRDLVVTATAPDGAIEALEQAPSAATAPGTPAYLLAVQWHPEAMRAPAQLGIYTSFVEACRAYAGSMAQPSC